MRGGDWTGGPMVAPRRVIALPTDAEQRRRLLEIAGSRTEPTSRVERARIILAYLDEPSAYEVARTIGVTQQTVTRCLERAAELGVAVHPAPALVAALAKAHAEGRLEERLGFFAKPKLLIIGGLEIGRAQRDNPVEYGAADIGDDALADP